jgi:molecular chaperone DnaJ
MAKRDYYEILGIPRDASKEDIKNSFRKLARQYHPDVSQEPDAVERFKEINEAYGILSEDEKRAAYDRYGHAGVQGTGGMPDFTTVDFSDIRILALAVSRNSQRSRNMPRRVVTCSLPLSST